MANRKNENLPSRRLHSGKRLREVMGDMTQTELLKAMKEKYGTKDGDDYYLPGMNDLQTLSNVINGRRTLKEDPARWAADILEIDVNYLLGTKDNFKLDNYDTYCGLYGPGRVFKKEWEKYSHILQMGGYKLINTAYDDNNKLIECIVSYKGHTARISADDMESFYADVSKYIKKRFAPVMDLGL